MVMKSRITLSFAVASYIFISHELVSSSHTYVPETVHSTKGSEYFFYSFDLHLLASINRLRYNIIDTGWNTITEIN